MALKTPQDKFESLDEDFFNSPQRKRTTVLSQNAVAPFLRLLVKLHTRRVYESKIDGSYYTYVDCKIGLHKYDTYDLTIKAKLCEAYINLGSMLKAG